MIKKLGKNVSPKINLIGFNDNRLMHSKLKKSLTTKLSIIKNYLIDYFGNEYADSIISRIDQTNFVLLNNQNVKANVPINTLMREYKNNLFYFFLKDFERFGASDNLTDNQVFTILSHTNDDYSIMLNKIAKFNNFRKLLIKADADIFNVLSKISNKFNHISSAKDLKKIGLNKAQSYQLFNEFQQYADKNLGDYKIYITCLNYQFRCRPVKLKSFNLDMRTYAQRLCKNKLNTILFDATDPSCIWHIAKVLTSVNEITEQDQQMLLADLKILFNDKQKDNKDQILASPEYALLKSIGNDCKNIKDLTNICMEKAYLDIYTKKYSQAQELQNLMLSQGFNKTDIKLMYHKLFDFPTNRAAWVNYSQKNAKLCILPANAELGIIIHEILHIVSYCQFNNDKNYQKIGIELAYKGGEAKFCALNEVFTEYLTQNILKIMHQNKDSILKNDKYFNSGYNIGIKNCKDYFINYSSLFNTAYISDDIDPLIDKFSEPNLNLFSRMIHALIEETDNSRQELIFQDINTLKQDIDAYIGQMDNQL